ncbi:hypothetical protein GCM10020001_032060 [Nonomuraea salmonea]
MFLTANLSETLTLLLIEDDDGDAFLVEELLKEAVAPPRIFRARSLSEARRKLTPEIQCVLVDLSLPDASRLEALEEVIALAPYTAVLVLTGLRDVHVGVTAVQAGAQDYLVKGDVEARLLARSIRYAMERKRADVAQLKLVQAELTAKENARLESALLPDPLLRTQEIEHVTRYLPGSGGTLAGDFFDTVQTPRRLGAPGDRRRLRPRPRRGRAGRGAAHRLAHAGAGRADRRHAAAHARRPAARRAPGARDLHHAVHGHDLSRPAPRDHARGRPPAARAGARGARWRWWTARRRGRRSASSPTRRGRSSTCRWATTGR